MVTQRSATADKPPVKVHWLYIPTPKPSILRLMLLALGVIVSWILALAILMIPILIIGEGFPNYTPPAWFPIAVFICAGYGPILWIYYYNRFNNRRLMKLTIGRSDRLACLMDHPDSLLRLPHRHVEHLMRSTKYTKRKLSKVLKKLPPAFVFIIDECGEEKYGLPEKIDTLFEPTDFFPDTEHIHELINVHVGMEDNEEQIDDHDTLELKAQRKRDLKQKMWNIFSMIGYGYFLFVSVQQIYRGSPWGSLAIISLAIALFIGLFTAVFANRRWWLVPGGLIYREDFAWRKGMRCSLITPDQSPLLLDWRTGIGMVLDGNKVRKFPMGEHARWLVATGWISQARSPTLEEVHTFLGMNKE